MAAVQRNHSPPRHFKSLCYFYLTSCIIIGVHGLTPNDPLWSQIPPPVARRGILLVSANVPTSITSTSRSQALQLISSATAAVVMLAITTALPLPSQALSPTEAAADYDTYAASYDQLDGGKASAALGMEQARSTLLKKARGHVLEIGVGTGLNLQSYDPSQISSLTLCDVSDGMLQQAANRAKTLPNLQGIPVTFVKADATSELVDRFGQAVFDTVVDSFSLCVMGTPGARQCLEQMSRVVKLGSAGGHVLLLENSRSSNSLLGLYQDATAGAAASTGGKGCVYNQNVGALIRQTGTLEVSDETLYAAGLFRSFDCSRIR